MYFPETYSKNHKIEYLECLEEYYIDKYDSYRKGYNVSRIPRIVGNTNTPASIQKGIETRRKNGSYVKSEEVRKRMSDALRNSTALKIAVERNSKKRRKTVYQYDLDGNFIREWESAREASISLCLREHSIRKNLLGVGHKIRSFMFSYIKEDKIESYLNKKKKIGRSKHTINMYDENDNIVKTFKDTDDCANYLQISAIAAYSRIHCKRRINGYLLVYGSRSR